MTTLRCVLWIGGVLLLLLFVADGWMPRTASSGTSTARIAFPPIRIHSNVKRPEAVVIVTTQASLPPASATEVAAAEGGASPSPVSGDSLDQSAFPSTLQQAAADSSPSAFCSCPSHPRSLRAAYAAGSGGVPEAEDRPSSASGTQKCSGPHRGSATAFRAPSLPRLRLVRSIQPPPSLLNSAITNPLRKSNACQRTSCSQSSSPYRQHVLLQTPGPT
jgi:hypothetical protein